MKEIAWLLPALPLAGFIINGLGRKYIPKTLAGIIGSATVLGAFIIGIMLFMQVHETQQGQVLNYYRWLSVGSLVVDLGLYVDQLSAWMILIITGIGFLIHVYSMGYMSHDEGHNKFFAYLNLFVFFMLVLVMGSNYPMMFIGWEGVGLCSYLLIGFWNTNTNYNNAAKKAFVMNRIGDLGFLLGMFMIYYNFGSLDYNTVFAKVAGFEINSPVLVAIALLLFVGAMGKSAQLPLYTWLPDAMAGPTPVSALIHAATMVTAGIYMIVRSNIIYTLAPHAQDVVMVVGLATSIFAAVIGLKQNDIKKVLAYSTVSQLGLMFMALGVGAYSSAMFHVTTHAFFKALLFLGSGSVIHAMGGEQDMRFMGGLKKKLPITFITFLLGTLAICGIPPLSGFFSKDEILLNAFMASPVIWSLAVISSLITTIYMLRLLFVTFYGKFRGTHEQEHHLHESPASMTIPLVILCILAVFGGLLNVPEIFGGNAWAHHYFSGMIISTGEEHGHHVSHATEFILMGVMLTLIAAAFVVLRNKYITKGAVPEKDEEMTGFTKLIGNKFMVDEIYDFFIVKPAYLMSSALYYVAELKFIDLIVNAIGDGIVGLGRIFRRLQTGNIGFYIFTMVLSIVAILVFKYFVV
ncbi:MAG: NADH-quinone oxidoreductase subunit L [Sphingobacteriales bacterium JAD_PAG50586_3]|nr:MAG: NADH-quinone oxidoreductase subunit L [Sphingobacteriales bacterium JAD_PAG50586_3]